MEDLNMPNFDIPMTGMQCSQCGLMHPPLPQGVRCPNAKANVEGLKDEDVRVFTASMQNMILYHLEVKKIKEPQNIFKDITLMIAKYLENI